MHPDGRERCLNEWMVGPPEYNNWAPKSEKPSNRVDAGKDLEMPEEKKAYTLCPWAREAMLRSGQSIIIDAEYLSCVKERCGKWGPIDTYNPPHRFGCTRTGR